MAKFEYCLALLEILRRDIFLFDWDLGNKDKNFIKHGVRDFEIEEAFYHENIVTLGLQYSPFCEESRFGFLAETKTKRKLFICFTIRNNKIRVINARPMSKKERITYERFHQE